MKLSHAKEVFLLSKEIAGFSPNTLRNYRLTLGRLCGHLGPGDPEIDRISVHDLRGFLHNLQTVPPTADYLIPREQKPLGPKSIRNVHANLSSLWGWAVKEGLVDKNIAHDIDPPNPKPTVIEPFDEDEIQALLKTIGTGSDTTGRLRDKAMLLFLLDTGVRASELCGLKIGDVDIKEGSAVVKGKGRLDSGQGKERVVLFGVDTRTAVYSYLLAKGNGSAKAELFTTRQGRPLKRLHLTTHLRRLGQRSSVEPCFPHKFRHSFAIFYLRNGGDIYTLQRLLGHSSLEMVKRYLSIASTDIEKAHRRASPVDNLNL